MSTTMRRATLPFVAALAAICPQALGDDAAPAVSPATSPEDGPKFEGDVRAGWRFVSREDEGRFPQDRGLKDGPRIFDMNLLATDRREGRPFDEAELHATGVGDANTDLLATLRKSGLFDLSGGWRRDDYSYRASGDPFSYDTVRERGFVRGRWTPSTSLTVRLSWDRNQRRGDGFTRGYISGQPLVGEDPSSVAQVRPIATQTDRFLLGADYATGIFKFGLTQTATLGRVDDDRAYEVPEARRGVNPVRGDMDRETTSTTWTTTGKAGVSLLDGKLDVTGFLTRTSLPLTSRMTRDDRGDDASGTFFTSHVEERTEIRREGLDKLVEAAWRPLRDVEVTATAQDEDLVDDASRRRFHFLSTAIPAGKHVAQDYRTTDSNRRYGLDASWQVSDTVRLRAGEQFLRESLYVPTDRPLQFSPWVEDSSESPPVLFGGNFQRGLEPEQVSSDSWRTTGGIDWKPDARLSASLLAHVTTNSDPQATPVARASRDFTFRTRWKALETLALSSVWRHADGRNLAGAAYSPTTSLGPNQVFRFDLHDRFLRSRTRSDSATLSGSWQPQEDWDVAASCTYQSLATRSDAAQYFGGANVVYPTVAFATRNVIANVEVRRTITKSLRARAGVTRTTANGDFPARWMESSVGAEYDLRKDLTLGLTLSSWRLADREAPADGYRACGAEASVTYRF